MPLNESILSEQDNKPETRIEKLRVADPGRRDLDIAQLQGILEKEKDARHEERFCWIISFAFVLDIVAIGLVNSVWLLFPFFLQLAVLIWLARRLGIDEIAVWLTRLWSLLERRVERGAPPRP